MTLLSVMTEISLSQSVLLAHGVLCLFTLGLLPSVLEVTLSIPKGQLNYKMKLKSNVSPYFNVFTHKKKKKEQQAVIKTLSAQEMDTPLTGAAFTHFIAFSKKAGTIVTGDLLPR